MPNTRQFSKTRLEALSDGLFAIMMTLLALALVAAIGIARRMAQRVAVPRTS